MPAPTLRPEYVGFSRWDVLDSRTYAMLGYLRRTPTGWLAFTADGVSLRFTNDHPILKHHQDYLPNGRRSTTSVTPQTAAEAVVSWDPNHSTR